MKTLLSSIMITGMLACACLAQESIIEPVPTPATAAERHAASIQRTARTSHTQLIAAYNRMMREFWHSKDSTPQEIADALGTKAASLFQLGGALAEFIVTADPGAASKLMQPVNAFTVHSDGTVTISDQPYQPNP